MDVLKARFAGLGFPETSALDAVGAGSCTEPERRKLVVFGSPDSDMSGWPRMDGCSKCVRSHTDIARSDGILGGSSRIVEPLYVLDAGTPEHKFLLLASVPAGSSGTVVLTAIFTALLSQQLRWTECLRGTWAKRFEDLRRRSRPFSSSQRVLAAPSWVAIFPLPPQPPDLA